MDTTKTEIKELLRVATPDEVVFAHIESPYWDEVVCYMEGDVLSIWSSEDNERQDWHSFPDYVLQVLKHRRELLDNLIENLSMHIRATASIAVEVDTTLRPGDESKLRRKPTIARLHGFEDWD